MKPLFDEGTGVPSEESKAMIKVRDRVTNSNFSAVYISKFALLEDAKKLM